MLPRKAKIHEKISGPEPPSRTSGPGNLYRLPLSQSLNVIWLDRKKCSRQLFLYIEIGDGLSVQTLLRNECLCSHGHEPRRDFALLEFSSVSLELGSVDWQILTDTSEVRVISIFGLQRSNCLTLTGKQNASPKHL